ncbi:hypothetical protein TNCT_369601 [Trichonephila clavata]|uniref:Uncharacterized protein n=1 Tax=Trichonephila clavata TaxID=2740835 RepID=A0A8X6HNJ5_TRICU|nr:hypothetical protein TNCT_369601 [Trichonephila clavata]
MKRRQGQPTITSFFKKLKAYNLDDAANVDNGDNISHLDSDDNISDPVTSTGFQEIVHPVWQANRFDIGNTNRNSLDDTTKKKCAFNQTTSKKTIQIPYRKITQ